MLSSPRRWILIASPLLTLTLLYYVFHAYNAESAPIQNSGPWSQTDVDHLILEGTQAQGQTETQVSTGTTVEEDRCGHIRRDMDDVMVILKTGATEAQEKVPVQLRTGLQCVPHFAVFSDYEEVINGVRKACQGRPVSNDDLAVLAQEVEEAIRASGNAEVDANDVGLAILGPLKRLDVVAYMRFASVYRGFENLDDFEAAIQELRHEELQPTAAPKVVQPRFGFR